MQLSHNDENNFSLSRFESMLKTNDVLFFDSAEVEDIINYYLENGKFALAKKAVKLGLAQHPTSTNLKLFKIEILVFEDKLDVAESMLTELQQLESSNEEVYIQKAQILSKRDRHAKAIEVLEMALVRVDGREHRLRFYFLNCDVCLLTTLLRGVRPPRPLASKFAP